MPVAAHGKVSGGFCRILGNPGATSRDDAMFSSERYFRAKVYFMCWRAWELILTQPVPEVVEPGALQHIK